MFAGGKIIPRTGSPALVGKLKAAPAKLADAIFMNRRRGNFRELVFCPTAIVDLTCLRIYALRPTAESRARSKKLACSEMNCKPELR